MYVVPKQDTHTHTKKTKTRSKKKKKASVIVLREGRESELEARENKRELNVTTLRGRMEPGLENDWVRAQRRERGYRGL